MRKIRMLSVFALAIGMLHVAGQQKAIDVRQWNVMSTLPLVLYLTGDGGYNTFSEQLCKRIAGSGYTVAAINSRKYFLKKRSVGQLVADISETLYRLMAKGHTNRFYLVGYSFGADAVPFLANGLDTLLTRQLRGIVLLEPSQTTDLKIHISDLLGRSNVKRSMDVVAEINKIKHTKTVIILGKEGADFPIDQIYGPHFETKMLDGGHDFAKKWDVVAQATVNSF